MNKTIITTICIILALSLGFGLVWPKYQSLVLKNAEAAAKTLDLQNRQSYYQEVAKTSEELKAYSEELSKIDSALPSEFFLPEMYDFFQKKASESGLVLKNESFGKGALVKDNPDQKEYRFSLELSGSYAAFKNFLAALEKSARMIKVEKISFSSPEKSGSAFSFLVSVKFYSY
jgi:Tfp pilus assembly protein PilO